MNRITSGARPVSRGHVSTRRDKIAICGIGCRLPGGIVSPVRFWELLRAGFDGIGPMPEDRWEIAAFYHPDAKRPGKLYTRAGGYLERIDLFDAEFFGVSPREASRMDPQQRLLLEMAWEALEDAGEQAETLAGANVGVFVGVSSNDYAHLQYQDLDTANAYTNVGNAASIVSNRISYFFDLHGPSMTIDTACSSSLVAVHEACQSIWHGESSYCLVGGINIILRAQQTVGFCKASMLSPGNHCRPFEDKGDGYARSEGGGVLVLKPLAQALEDGNPIYATILASGANSDGRTNGIFLPSDTAQAALLRKAYNEAGVQPEDVTYIEAHGTGTSAGDPIECAAIGRFLDRRRSSDDPCLVGSVKSNIGHLEPAAGMAGLIKAALSLKHREIPATINIETLNTKIPFEEIGLRVVVENTPLPVRERPAIMGVNSFGFGGANAHVVLEEHVAEPVGEDGSDAAPDEAGAPTTILPLCLSARTETSLQRLAAAYRDLLAGESAVSLADVCAGAAFRRSHLEHRLTACASTRAETARALDAFLAGERPAAVTSHKIIERDAKVAFVFSGNGPQWWAMGQELLAGEPLFREWVERIDAVFRPLAGWSVLDELSSGEQESRIERTEFAQPALFAVQVGVFEVLRARGLHPRATFGHSVGEVAAAYAAGALTLDQATRVIFERSRAQAPTAGRGKMAAVGLAAADVEALLARHDDVVLAAINSPTSVTLSGDPAALEAIGAELAERNVFFRMLRLDYAFHSHTMDPIRDGLVAALHDLTPRPAVVPFVSTVTGDVIDGGLLDAEYWWQNVRRPVRFSDAVNRLIEDGIRVFVEVGPHPVLMTYVTECVRAKGSKATAIGTLRREEPEAAALWTTFGTCYGLGVSLDLKAVLPAAAVPVALPSYPWDHDRYWHEGRREWAEHPLLGYRARTADGVWTHRLDTAKLDFLQDHVVRGAAVFPAAASVEMALAAAGKIFEGKGHEIEDLDIRRPLVVAHDQPPFVQFAVAVDDGSFRLCSRATKDEGPWSVNVVGKLGLVPSDRRPEPLAIATLKARLPRTIARQAHYEMTAAVGLHYGASFQGVRRIWAGAGEALGQVALPACLAAEGSAGEYHLHPAVLDSCFQVVLGLVAGHADQGRPQAYLPVQIHRLRYWGGGEALAYCHARLIKVSAHSLLADLSLLDAKGRLIAEIEGFRFQRASFGHEGATPLYRYEAQLAPSAMLQALAEAGRFDVDGLAQRLAPTVAERTAAFDRPGYYTDFARRRERLCAAYVAQAFRRLGVGCDAFTLESLMRLDGGALMPSAVSGAAGGGALAAARDALRRKDHPAVRDYLERVLPDAVRAEWPRTPSGALKVDRQSLRRFADRADVAALLDEGGGGLLELYGRLVGRFVEILADEGWARPHDGGWILVDDQAFANPRQLWQELVRDYPGHVAELILLGRCGEHIAEILTGALDPLSIFNVVTLEHLYETSPGSAFYNALIAATIDDLVRTWPANRKLRILEVGAGTGGVTTSILGHLPQDRTEYTYTDLSDLFVSQAEAKYAAYPFMHYARLNIDEDPQAQGFDAGGYDLVIAANVVHATPVLSRTLDHIKTLLAANGLFLLLEVHGCRGLDLTFGFLKQWWDFTDLELRPHAPLLSAERWSAVLEASGFDAVATFSDAAVTATPESSVFLARKGAVSASGAADRPIEVALETTARRSYLLLVDDAEAGRGLRIARALDAEGHRIVTVRPAEAYARLAAGSFAVPAGDARAFDRLALALKKQPCDEIVNLWGIDEGAIEEPAALTELQDRRCLGTIALLQALQRAAWSASPRLWLITAGAAQRPDGGAIDPAQAPLWGLGRVVQNEYPDLDCRLVDLDPAGDPAEIDRLLLEELRQPDGEDEILLSAATRYAHRLKRITPACVSAQAERTAAADASAFRLDFTAQGSLDNLYLRAVPRPVAGPGQVVIKVKAAGLNFRDVMWAMGILPEDALENGFAGPTLGMECSGEVIEAGPGVEDFKPGDAVVTFAPACFSSHVVADQACLARKPAQLSFAEAATIPTVFFTAYYALETLAHLRKGERILIHGAAGGVGLAAMQIAKWRGAEVFATAGSAEKQDFVRFLGADHVLSSRSLAFADEIMALTEGKGVDVVLNSLAGEAIHKNLMILKPFGRFLEIGKRDLYANSKIGLRPFRNNISYFAIDADQLMIERRELAAETFAAVFRLLEAGVLHPLVHRTFPVGRVADAFRLMQQSKHIGKIIVTMDAADAKVVSTEKRALSLRPDASYLVTGGVSGFGLATAKWLIEKGARTLVLVSRSGAATAAARAAVAEMEASGVRVVVAKADVADADALAAVIGRCGSDLPALRGVIHAAMVLDDVVLANANSAQWHRVLAPKMLGAWNLHRLTRAAELDFFVLYSSFAAVVGNPGQANYVAANLFMEALAHLRRRCNLPALAVGWGAIDDVGYLARKEDLKETLEKRTGLRPIASREALAVLEEMISADATQVGAAEVDWAGALRFLPSGGRPKFTALRGQGGEAGDTLGQSGNFKDNILALPEAERLPAVTHMLAEVVAKILRLPVAKLDVQRPVLELGVDSLMALELQMTIEKEFGVAVPTMEFLGGLSTAQVAARVLTLATGPAGDDAPVAKAAPAPAGDIATALVQEIDDLSDEAVDALLDQALSEAAN